MATGRPPLTQISRRSWLLGGIAGAASAAAAVLFIVFGGSGGGISTAPAPGDEQPGDDSELVVPEKSLAEALLSDALLGPDMGYTRVGGQAVAPPSRFYCDGDAILSQEAAASASATFLSSSSTDLMWVESVYAYSSDSLAESVFSELRDVIVRCLGSVHSEQIGGADINVMYSATPSPAVGDDSFAVRRLAVATGTEIDPLSIAVQTVFMRVGPYLATASESIAADAALNLNLFQLSEFERTAGSNGG